MKNKKYLLLSVFIAGMCTLAIEFVTSRIIQAIFGTSNMVWANVIGLVLLFLTLGYFIGGRLVDKNPSPAVFYWLISAAGFSAVFFLLMTSALLRETASTLAVNNVGPLIVSMIVVIMGLAVPVTILGIISPYAIRLAVTDVGEAGQISGRIYAISTMGSLFGTYIPVLFVIPSAGSKITAIIFGSVLLLNGLIGVWQVNRSKLVFAIPFLLLPFIYLWSGGAIKNTPNQIYETESSYNYIQVTGESSGCVSLRLNESVSEHSVYCNGNFIAHSTYMIAMVAPYLNAPGTFDVNHPLDSVLMIGSAAGTQPANFAAAFPGIDIHGIELDPKIIDAGNKYFGMADIPNFTTHIGDGRYMLNALDRKFDEIVIDAYKPPYIPWHMTTVEYFQEAKARLTENGTLVLNVIFLGEDYRLVEAMTSTLLEVFPSVHAVKATQYNIILIATKQPTVEDNIWKNKARFTGKLNRIQRILFSRVKDGLIPAKTSGLVFTDEVAPVEPLIDSMLLRQAVSIATGTSESDGIKKYLESQTK